LDKGELHLLARRGKKWEEQFILEPGVPAYTLFFHPGGKLLAAGTPGIENETRAALSVYSLETKALVYRLRMEFPYLGDTDRSAAWAAAFSPDGSLLVTGAGSQLKLYSAANGALLAGLPANIGVILDVQFSPDGRLLATLGEEGVIRLWGVPAR
jgi:hypothetical protein